MDPAIGPDKQVTYIRNGMSGISTGTKQSGRTCLYLFICLFWSGNISIDTPACVLCGGQLPPMGPWLDTVVTCVSL